MYPLTQTAKKAKSEETKVGPTGKPLRRPDQPKKVKLRDKKTLPVPGTQWADDSDVSDLGEDEDLDIGAAGSFLAGLDAGALARWVVLEGC